MNAVFKMESQAFDRSREGCPGNQLGDSYSQTLAFVAAATTPQMLLPPNFYVNASGVSAVSALAKISQMDLLQRDTNSWLCLHFRGCPGFLRTLKPNKTFSRKQYVRGHHSPFHGAFMNIHLEKSRSSRVALNYRSNFWSVESPKLLGWRLLKVPQR